MGAEVAQNFLDKLRKHFETGVPWQDMSFSKAQKVRIEIALDAYKRFAQDPYMDLTKYIKNKYNRTYSELHNDIRVVDFISSFYEAGQRNISSMKVRHSADVLMRTGQEMGDMRAVYNGASLLTKLDRLDQPESGDELGDELIHMPVVVTGDIKKKFPNRVATSPEELERIRRKYGVKKDKWQEAIDTGQMPKEEKKSLEEE